MRLLLIAWFDPKGIEAVLDHINSIKSESVHKITLLNTFGFRHKFRKYFKVSLTNFDGVILHNTVTYNPFNLLKLNDSFSPYLSDFKGIKVLMKQDEMKNINSFKEILINWNVTHLTTCLDKINAEKVYGASLMSKIKALHTLTGYASEEFKKFTPVPLDQRPLDVVYRGMETPFEWGRLAFEKYMIGDEFKKRALGTDLKINISSRDEDRINGKNWFQFLSSSRSTLAVESGASIFDFDGSIEAWCRKFKLENPSASFEDAYNIHLKKFDGLVNYNQISPRHIEAVALGTVQIMFEGDYSGIFIPGRHYIPLKKDFSNFDEVISSLKDLDLCKRISANARAEILTREDVTFKSFVKKFDNHISS